jgi:hypothetical protein
MATGTMRFAEPMPRVQLAPDITQPMFGRDGPFQVIDGLCPAILSDQGLPDVVQEPAHPHHVIQRLA